MVSHAMQSFNLSGIQYPWLCLNLVASPSLLLHITILLFDIFCSLILGFIDKVSFVNGQWNIANLIIRNFVGVVVMVFQSSWKLGSFTKHFNWICHGLNHVLPPWVDFRWVTLGENTLPKLREWLFVLFQVHNFSFN